MKLCRHERYTTIDWIKEPKYSTNEILIDKLAVDNGQEHLLIKFTQAPSMPDWFYMSRKMVRRHRTQANGAKTVYVVPLSKREAFEQLKPCPHSD